MVAPAPQEMYYALLGTVEENRLRAQKAEEERAAFRASELATQVAPGKDAEERIRIWERLHALRLPRTATHILVNVIATQTHLTVRQVNEEQRRRAATIVRPGPLLPEGGTIS